MRRTVLVPVEKILCDAHLARDGSEEEAADTLTLGERAWDLCGEHAVTFGRHLIDTLGTGLPESDTSAVEPLPTSGTDSVSIPETVSETETETEPVAKPSVVMAGEVPGYDWETARDAVRNLGYTVVGRADESTVLLILGEGGERNVTKIRDASELGIPCMDVRAVGRFKSAVCAGVLAGGDPLPEPVTVVRSEMSERERNRAIREWARSNGWSTLRGSGRIPADVRCAYEMAHRNGSGGKAAAA
ncbi:Lsr2 family DNA-binding protein [Streptomyces albipurpureus]|uniref:Lsr2 family DNA-binding protein n=1 Tax=Streptomyces albipurpureus TaxID=2897419 RepID=UPI003CE5A265